MEKSESCPELPTEGVRLIRAKETPILTDPLPDLKLPPLVLHHNFESRIIHKSKHNTPYETPPPPGRASSEPSPSNNRDDRPDEYRQHDNRRNEDRVDTANSTDE
jgi:hypothetical protein